MHVIGVLPLAGLLLVFLMSDGAMSAFKKSRKTTLVTHQLNTYYDKFMLLSYTVS